MTTFRMSRATVLVAYVTLFPLSLVGADSAFALAQPEIRRPVDMVVVLDNSGSMRANDPDYLIRQVVREFAAGLAPETRLQVLLFDQDVRMPLALSSVEEADFLSRVERSVEQLDYRGQRTDLPAAIERAVYDLRDQGRTDAVQVIVILTDGVVDVGSPARDIERRGWLRDNLAVEADRLGIRVFGIAFTEKADLELLQVLSQVTGGAYFRAPRAEDIPALFGDVDRLIATEQEAAVEGVGGTVGELSVGQTPVSKWYGAMIAVSLLLAGTLAAVRRFRRRREVAGQPLETSVTPVPAAALYGVMSASSGMVFPVDKPITNIGRIPDVNDITIDEPTISAQHAVIEFRDGVFYVRDLCSKNGSFLNDVRFSDPKRGQIREVPLRHRDRLRFDDCELEFVVSLLEACDETRFVVGEDSCAGLPVDRVQTAA